MHADPVTRCPHCQAVYRVTLAQLAQAQGWLRCAQCRAPFDGTGLQVTWSAEANEDPETATRVDIQDLLHKQDHSAAVADRAGEDPLQSFEQALATFPGQPDDPRGSPLSMSPEPLPAEIGPEPAAPAAPRRHSGLLLVLLVLLLLQGTWAVRPLWWQTPWLAGAAQSLCGRMGCTWPALREPDQLLIDSSRLVRTEEGYRLEWVLHNQSVWPVQMPAMELVLNDASEAVLVRRVVQADHMQAPDRLEPMQRWESALELSLAQGQEALGYRLRVFYP